MENWTYVLAMAGRLVLSAVLASVVGFEREMHGRPAGLRTHMLVGLGATLFTIASVEIAGTRGDTGRIAAQIVTGVGFLGAGTIIQHGSVVRGLTTAATLWAVAGVGLAVGLGGKMTYTAVAATLIIYLTLTVNRRIERRLEGRHDSRELFISSTDARVTLHRTMELLDEMGIETRSVVISSEPQTGLGTLAFSLHRPGGLPTRDLTGSLAALPNVTSLEWR